MQTYTAKFLDVYEMEKEKIFMAADKNGAIQQANYYGKKNRLNLIEIREVSPCTANSQATN